MTHRLCSFPRLHVYVKCMLELLRTNALIYKKLITLNSTVYFWRSVHFVCFGSRDIGRVLRRHQRAHAPFLHQPFKVGPTTSNDVELHSTKFFLATGWKHSGKSHCMLCKFGRKCHKILVRRLILTCPRRLGGLQRCILIKDGAKGRKNHPSLPP